MSEKKIMECCLHYPEVEDKIDTQSDKISVMDPTINKSLFEHANYVQLDDFILEKRSTKTEQRIKNSVKKIAKELEFINED